MENFNKTWKKTSKKDRLDFSISLIVISLTTLFIVYYTFDFNKSSSSSIVNRIDTLTSDEELTTISEIKILEKSTSPLKSILYPKNKIFKKSITIQEPSKSSSYTLKKNTLFKAVSSDSFLIDSIVLSELDTDSITINIDTVRSDSKTTLLNDISDIDYTDQKEECIILVGSYLISSNADKMYKKLVSSEFKKAFTSKKNKYTRVGIYTSCNETILNSNLERIKTQFAKDAIHFIESQ